MTTDRSPELEERSERLFNTFSRYSAGSAFCTFCWDSAEVDAIAGVELRAVSSEMARKLLWEAADHWESSDAYKYYLPRILTSLAPPESLEDLYPAHLFETLLHLGFRFWPELERETVHHFLDAVTPHLALAHPEDRAEWERGRASLKIEARTLPPRA